jgi:glycosyltransferase involved in cell wall biosynthesis
MGSGHQIALITSGFPRISETFALNELLALDRAGSIGPIFATKPGDGRPPQPGVEALTAKVEVLDGDSTDSLATRVVARLARCGTRGLHAYFAHEPAAVAQRAAALLDVPYSFTAHARDIRKVPLPELTRRARGAMRVIACNQDVAGELRRLGSAVELIPHGVDLRRFFPVASSGRGPLRLLAVGRLVEKKGFEVLLDAVAGLEMPFRLTLVGEGPLRSRLEHVAAIRHMSDRVEFCGAVTHDQLASAYADADVVVVPSVQDRHGDRDGLPNVVLEAMASGRPVLASRIAAIPSVVKHDETGVLGSPGDVPGLRAALARLGADPLLRIRLGVAARRVVERDFELGSCTDRLRRCLEDLYG